MIRIAKEPEEEKIEELKRKIHDEKYLKEAIQKIASDLTLNLVQED